MAQTKTGTALTAATPRELDPDARPLNRLQAARLGALAGLSAKELIGQNILQLGEKLKWRIDPSHFLFRKVCGKVVKKDPVTGVEYPVPFATVIVEDTDCSLLAYFPKQWQYGWFFPLNCRREVLATVKTDRCGRFCVYIPRFDIDAIVRWRHERFCFSDIFVRPDLGDLVATVDPRIPVPPRPERIFGARIADPAAAAPRRAFAAEMPPPLPVEFQQALGDAGSVVGADKGTKAFDAVRGAIAANLGVAPGTLERLDLGRFIGPFRRCIDIVVPEWHLIVDTPDITFRVTQDTNGDGIEETIYSEGHFDVRWNAGAIPDVTLVASPAARATRGCDTPSVPCKDVPEILFAGMMPLADPVYFNAAEGYALRPNRPMPAGPRPAAKTPFLGTLQLFGCVNVPKAGFYRVMASDDNGATYAAVTGLTWNIYPLPSGAPHPVVADAAGWYPVLADPDAFHLGRMLLEWPTPTLGKVMLKLELADAAKAPLPVGSNVVAVQVDNTAPEVLMNRLAWKFTTEPDAAFTLPGRNLLVNCATIRRGAVPRDIEVQFDVSVNAHHLRDAYLFSQGCGGAAFTLTSPPAATTHWHQTVLDNAVLLSGRYRLDAAALEGAYGFGCRADSRAMNPSGGDGGHLLDWLYDPVYAFAQPQVEVAIING